MAIFAESGLEALAHRRAQRTDPAHGGEAGRKRGRRNADHVRANAEWDRSHGGATADVDFARDILPGLQGTPLSAIQESTGLSLRYCSVIRRGLQVPHRRHWPRLLQLVDLAQAAQTTNGVAR
ncbi:MAG: hypothetical protein M3Q10_02490 [Chloroflexota bacterium]|nr:hypothetical protein [Chloroflexota bacterium]